MNKRAVWVSLLISGLMLSELNCLAQDSLHLADSAMAKCRVKKMSVVCKDSKTPLIYEYDTLGRERLVYLEGSNSIDSFIYYRIGDTTCRLKFEIYKGVATPGQIERYLFDVRGHVTLYECYLRLSVSPKETPKTHCQKRVYRYDELGHLQEVTVLGAKYKRAFDTSLRIPDDDLRPLRGSKFTYDERSGQSICHETNCPETRCDTDTTIRDNKGRLVVRRSYQAWDGPHGSGSWHLVERFTYKTRKTLIDRTIVYDDNTVIHEKLEEHFLPNGLEEKGWSGCRSTYEYY